VARIDLAPDEAVEVLLGAPRTPAGLTASAGQRLTDGGVRLDLSDPTGAVVRSLEWGPDALLRRVETRSAGGAVLWSADYADFRRLGSAGFAHQIAIHFPTTGTEVRLEFEGLELNPVVPEGTFVLQVPGVGALVRPGKRA
jgi:hypothetical protein